MKAKNIITSITIFLMAFGLWSTAEDIVGKSIFTTIETPHPYPQYPKVGKNNTLVWSTTIHQPGSEWIKIHFSSFRLNAKDIVRLLDEQDRVIEQISFRDVDCKHNTRFKSYKNGDGTVKFWTRAYNGEKLIIEVHHISDKPAAWGFKIDEIGVGCKPIFRHRLEPIYGSNRDFNKDFQTFKQVDIQNFPLIQMIAPDQTIERVLYKKGNTWYTCEGKLSDDLKNKFLIQETYIDSQKTIETMKSFFISIITAPSMIILLVKTFIGINL